MTVTAPLLASVQVTPNALGLTPGQQVQLSVSARFSNGTSREVAGETQWSSSPPGVVSVSFGGLVTAIGAGRANVFGFFQGRSVQVAADVTGGGVALLTLSKNAHDFESVEVGSTAEVVLTVTNSGTGPAQFGTISTEGLGLVPPYSLASTTCPNAGTLLRTIPAP